MTFLSHIFLSIVLVVQGFFGHAQPIAVVPIATSTVSNTTNNLQAATTSTITKTPPVMTPASAPVVTPTAPSNTTLCNGTYYTNCPSGNTLVCPNNGGKAYCTSSTPTQQPTQKVTPPTGVTTDIAATLQMKTECATLGLQKENSDKTSLIGTESIIRDAYGYSPSLNTCVYAAEYEFPTLNTIDASFYNLITGTGISLPQSGSWLSNTRTLPAGEFNYNGWVYDCNNLPSFINTGNQLGQQNWVQVNTGQSCGVVWIYTPGIDTTKAVAVFNNVPYDYVAQVQNFWTEYSTLVPQ
ncbi:MAG TPA: hypothetical protein VMR46_02445 [Candidatus Paceibacterota bacterium]|jgi:hypothetical protein|nr:hypothetical protein [Candidatus Paceibacterota bacterium]